MKRLLLSILMSSALLMSCSLETKAEDQEKANQVSETGAIAQLMSGTSTRILFSGEDNNNYVYKPYNPPKGSEEVRIPSSSLLLSTWFAFDLEKDDKATLEWSFDKVDYVTIKMPELKTLPHATVTFNKFPEDKSEVKLVLSAKIKYKTAESNVIYNITLKNSRA